jgi:parallel beta-helix repeat protein
MKKRISLFLCGASLFLAMVSGCGPSAPATPVVSTPRTTPGFPDRSTPPGLVPWDRPLMPPSLSTILVTRADDERNDDGSPARGTLRYALQFAQAYDRIGFDTSIFDPENPATIFIGPDDPNTDFREDELLPQIQPAQHHLILDATGAGVILDGTGLVDDWEQDWKSGLQIVGADGVTIRGLQISGFPGPAIGISGDAHYNMIEGNRLTENKEGINLSTCATSHNTIVNNDIGVGVGDVAAGNHNRGITIGEGAHDNTIGPGNHIAYNGPAILETMNQGCGIIIENTYWHTDEDTDVLSNSYGNLLTQNSIHDNQGDGICLVDGRTQNRGGANSGIGAPYLLSVDVPSGSVSGLTCPGCTVEVFSTGDSTQHGAEGEFYEGQAVADVNGDFTFHNGGFTQPYITATATDVHHNTSEFSRAGGLFEVSEDWEILQAGNSNQAFLLLTKPSRQLPDNHISAWLDNYTDFHNSDLVYRNGFKRIHIISLTGRDQDPRTTILNAGTLTREVEDTVYDYDANGVKIVMMLADPGSGVPFDFYHFDMTFQSQEEIDTYLEYVSFVVDHFKGRIPYYEILNEPGYISVSTYAEVISQTVPTIWENDHDASITIGSIHGPWEDDFPGYDGFQRYSLALDYLNELLRVSGDVASVDGVSWHPFFDNTPSDPYYQNYPHMVQGIKSLAASQGFTGEYFADDMLWSLTDEPNWDNGPPVSLPIAAKYYARAITEHRGLGTNVTINPFFQKPFLEPVANLCNLLAGAEPTTMALSLETGGGANLRYYAFELPGNDRLVALWTNDEAVEEDPGIKANLTFPGTSAHRVTGIDVFHGFEQDLAIETGGGNLVINDLRLKDYPVFIRLNDVDFDGQASDSEPLPGMPFTGVWQGTDRDDGSTVTLSLAQIGSGLVGSFDNTYSGDASTPGFGGNGSGATTSDSSAQMSFDLSREDDSSVTLQLVLTLSDQNNTLTLNSETGWSIDLQRR